MSLLEKRREEPEVQLWRSRGSAQVQNSSSKFPGSELRKDSVKSLLAVVEVDFMIRTTLDQKMKEMKYFSVVESTLRNPGSALNNVPGCQGDLLSESRPSAWTQTLRRVHVLGGGADGQRITSLVSCFCSSLVPGVRASCNEG